MTHSAWRTQPCHQYHHSLLPQMAHTHTHTRLTALFPGLPKWASTGTRKVKPIWILLEQETVSGSDISWAICKSAPRSRQMTMPAAHHSSFFTGRMPFLPPNQQHQSTEGNLPQMAVYNKRQEVNSKMTGECLHVCMYAMHSWTGWKLTQADHRLGSIAINQSCIFRMVQVIKSLLDPLEVGNNLTGINDNVRERGIEQKCFRCWWKVDRDGAEITLSGRLFQMVGPVTGKARPPTVPADDWSEQSGAEV